MAEQIAELPPSAMAIFAIALAVLFAIRYFGFQFGVRTPVNKSEAAAPVAAVIVDSTALMAATAAVEALNMTLVEYNMLTKKFIEGESELAEEIDKLREELKITREVERATRR